MLFDFRAACELRLASFVPKHASRSLCGTTSTHNLRTKGRILAFYIPNDFSTIADVPFRPYNSLLAPTGKLHLQTLMVIAFSYDILCVCQAQVETTGGYNTTPHQMTPVLPRMLHSMLKASVKLQSTNCDPVLTSFLVNCTQVDYMYVRQQTYEGTTHQTTPTLPTMHPLHK